MGECEVTATAASDANYNEATATFTVTVQPVGTLVLNLDVIANDDTVNLTEKAAGFTIGGNTGSESGVTVTVTAGTTELPATSAAGGAWSVSVPANAAYITESSVTVTVSASKTGFTPPSAVTRTFAVDLTAPTASYTAPLTLKVGVAIGAMTPSTSATDIASYRATGLPAGLTIDAGTGVISGTPGAAAANPASATVTVTDTAGNPATASITFPTVAKGDQTLTGFAYGASSVAFGDTAPTVTAPTGVRTSLSYSAMPTTVCTVDSSTGALMLLEVGECEVTATAASDANYNEATADYTVTVQPVGTLVLNLDVIANDDTVNLTEKAAGFTINGNTGSESGVTVTVTAGTTELPATSAAGGAWSVGVPANAAYITESSVTVTVSASKTGFTPPSAVTRMLAVDLTAPSASYTAPTALTVGVAIGAMTPSTSATDIASYGATGLPSGLSIDTGTGVISGTPDTAASPARATVTVTDTAGNPADVSITFPVVAKGDQTLTGFAYSASSVAFGDTAPTVTAPTGVRTSLSYSATPTTVCTVDSSTGALMLLEVGECEVTATAASDANYNEATAGYTVTVQPVGTLVLNLDVIANDDTVNLTEKAAGFTINGNTGSESGVTVTVTVGGSALPATSAAGGAWSVGVPANAAYITESSVTVTVSASKTGFTPPSAVTRTFAVDLTAPTASYTAPLTLKVGMAIGAMTPSTSATDIASYRATGLPSGLSIDAGTGVISGTPDTAAANPASATVTVTDTAGNPADVSITFPVVAKGDQTLTGFSYRPATVTFGSAAPTLTAPTGVRTTLSFSATPTTVCTVDAGSGALTLAGMGECVVTATAEGTADYNQGTADFTVTVQMAGTLALNLDAIAGDDTVNIAEKAAGFTISGATGSEADVSVTVTVGPTELTATSTAATWSVSVPANATYVTGTSVTVTVSATKASFTSPGPVTRTLTVDLTAPSVSYTAPDALLVGVAIGPMTPSTSATDIDGYSATGLPAGLSIDAGTGVISGTPGTAAANPASATVTVTDTAGNPADVSITFPVVAKGDQTLTGIALRPEALTVREGESGTWEVALASEPTGTVTVDVSSQDPDVTVAPASLTFTASDWSEFQTVTVHVADDDEPEEDATVSISHAASGADYVSVTATLVVTIPGHEDTSVAKAWLARSGRTIAQHVLAGLQERLRAPREAGFEGALAGRGLDTSGAGWRDGRLPARAGTREDEWRDGRDGPARSDDAVTLRDLVTGSAFRVGAGNEETGFGEVWGRGAHSFVGGTDADLRLDGEVTTGTVGADYQRGRWTGGAALSHSEAEADYRSDTEEGRVGVSLTGVYPYAGFAVTDRVSVWGAGGYGEGDLQVEPDEGERAKADIRLTMVAAGIRGTLVKRADGFEAAAKADVLQVRTTSTETAELAAVEGRVGRVRLGLEGARPFALDNGASVTPELEVGVRHDGGDAETGFGMDLGAGLRWSAPGLRLSGDVGRSRAPRARGRGVRGMDGVGIGAPRAGDAFGPGALVLADAVVGRSGDGRRRGPAMGARDPVGHGRGRRQRIRRAAGRGSGVRAPGAGRPVHGHPARRARGVGRRARLPARVPPRPRGRGGGPVRPRHRGARPRRRRPRRPRARARPPPHRRPSLVAGSPGAALGGVDGPRVRSQTASPPYPRCTILMHMGRDVRVNCCICGVWCLPSPSSSRSKTRPRPASPPSLIRAAPRRPRAAPASPPVRVRPRSAAGPGPNAPEGPRPAPRRSPGALTAG